MMGLYTVHEEYGGSTELDISEVEEVLATAAERFKFLSYDERELKLDGKVEGEAFLSVNRSSGNYNGRVSSEVLKKNYSGEDVVKALEEVAEALEK